MSDASLERPPTLAELQDWARDPAGDNWQNLLRVLTDLFLADVESHAEIHGQAYSEIVCRMLDELAADVRAELSLRIARIAAFPEPVVKRLAQDEDANVSNPVIENSPVLTDADLVEIIELMMPSNTLAITRRARLGKTVTDSLVANGDQEAIRSVTSNSGAAFSERTMRVIAEKAKHDPQLCERLVDRKDVAPAIAVQLAPFLSEELKARLRKPDEPEGGSLLDSLSEITAAIDKGEPSRKNKVEAMAAIEQVKSGAASMDETASKIAAVGHVSVLFLFLAEMAEIPEKSVMSSFSARNGTPFAVMCKGLHLSQKTFSSIAHLRAKRTGTPAGELTKFIEDYANLNTGEAEKAWKKLREKENGLAGD